MIIFDLQCTNGHIFEGWFEDGKAFKHQKKKKLISCPMCNDANVNQMPSTFAIKSRPQTPQIPSHEKQMAQLGKKIVDYVEKNFDDVGCDFTAEALKIHYGVAEQRNIRGTSTDSEEELLKKEGVDFFKMPLPISSNQDS